MEMTNAAAGGKGYADPCPDLEQRMRAARKLSGLTQKDMAATCGLSASYISAMERGVSKASARTFLSYCEETHTSPLEMAGRVSEYDSVIIPELVRLLLPIPPHRQRILCRLLASVSGGDGVLTDEALARIKSVFGALIDWEELR